MYLGLDLASRLTGWCAGAGDVDPQLGVWKFDPCEGDYGFLLDQLHDHLSICLDRFRPEVVGYEKPILVTTGRGSPYGDSLERLRMIYPLGAFVEWMCRTRGIRCFEVTVGEVKKTVTGSGRADKADVVAIARKVGLTLPPKTAGAGDASDAWGVWLFLLRHFNRERADAWARRIGGPNGCRSAAAEPDGVRPRAQTRAKARRGGDDGGLPPQRGPAPLFDGAERRGAAPPGEGRVRWRL
jgi:Holliday junction resolvasome RuvABC endonuclease subunit